MTDIVDTQTRSRMMSGIRGKNTKPEVTVRKALHRLGIRFKLHEKSLAGKPDIVLPKYRAVINVHGCFWHGHEGCRYFRIPSTRTDFWTSKIRGNQIRDQSNSRKLQESGWRVLTVWECALRGKKPESLGATLDLVSSWLRSDALAGVIGEPIVRSDASAGP